MSKAIGQGEKGGDCGLASGREHALDDLLHGGGGVGAHRVVVEILQELDDETASALVAPRAVVVLEARGADAAEEFLQKFEIDLLDDVRSDCIVWCMLRSDRGDERALWVHNFVKSRVSGLKFHEIS